MNDQQCSEIALEFNRHIINLLDSLSALSELAALSIHDFDESQLLRHALEALMSNQDMERCSVFLLGAGDMLTNAAGLDWDEMLHGITRQDGDEALPSHIRTSYRSGEGIMGLAATTGQIQHCRSCAHDPLFTSFNAGTDAAPIQGALICIPISCEEQVLGVLNVFYPEPDFFTVWHERLLLLFCQILGRLLLNHRYTHHLSSLLDQKTQETMATNAALREEITHRQEVAQRLEDQHHFLQSVVDSIPDPVMVIGTDYRLLMANAQARKNSLPAGAETTLTCHQLSHGRETPCAGDEHECPLRSVQERNDTASVIHQHQGPNGEPRLIELSAAPIRAADGQILAIVESGRDITERKQLEIALRSAKDYAENLIQTANILVVELDVDGKLKVFNPAAEAATGYSVADLAGRNWFEVLVPRDRYPHVWEEFERLMQGGMPRQFENPIRTKSGHERYIAWQNSVIHHQGKIAGVVSFGMDVTERKTAEKRLREIERRSRALLDASAESTMLLDLTGRILAINSTASERFGKLPADMVGTNFFSYLPAELADNRRRLLDQVAALRAPLHSKDRRGLIDFENSLIPVFDDAGEVESVAVYARDVTERQRNIRIDAMFHRLDLMLLKWGMDMKSIAQMFCDEVLSLFDLSVAWIGRAEKDGTLTFIAASEKAGHHLLDTLRAQCQGRNDGILSCPPAKAALGSGQMQQITDDNSAQCASCRQAASAAGIHATLILPLVMRGENWGTLALYTADTTLFQRLDIPPIIAAISNRLCISLEASLQQEWLSLLNAAVAHAGNAVFITDAAGRISWTNPSFGLLSGYAMEDVLGKTPRLFKSGAQDAEFYRTFWQTIQAGKTWRGEVVNVRPDGTRYIVNQTVTPLLDAHDQICNYVSILEDITDRKANEVRIEHLAHFDLLTDLPNRSLFFDRLSQALAMARREGKMGALLFLDLDGFKAVNDSFGHEKGDLLLQEVAVRLREQARETDTVARLGGDEFILMLPTVTTADDAIRVANKTVDTLAQPFDLNGTVVTIGASIGVALFPEHGDDVEKVVGAADRAMYMAKHAGRNTVRVCAST